MIFKEIQKTIQKAENLSIATERISVLNQLIDYCQKCIKSNKPVNLNFICTHNSRRSQLSQIWAQTLAAANDIAVHSFSGGVEVTAFNQRAVASLQRAGFHISGDESDNPHYQVMFSSDYPPVTAFSKTFDDETNPTSDFAAVMTCSDADQNCPFIPGANARIPLRYEDPKAFDDTELEVAKYDERSLQIASEMVYVFNELKKLNAPA